MPTLAAAAHLQAVRQSAGQANLMTHPSKQKGNRAERELVYLHNDMNVSCARVPLSGAVGGQFSGDLEIELLGKAEVKARKSGQGFKTIERWLGDNALLFLRRNNARPLVVMPWETYKRLWGEINEAHYHITGMTEKEEEKDEAGD